MTWVGRALIFVVAFAPCSTLRAQAAPDIRQARAWTLEEAVAAALAQHPLVEAARARLDAAHAERAGASALANPVGTLWLENVGYPGQRASAGARESSLYVTYPLESLVQRGPRINRADQDVNAAQASLAVARRAVAAETVQYFFAVALAQALQEEADENRDRLEQLVAYNRVRAEAGVTAEGELLRLEVELDRARNDVVFAGVELMKQQSRLAPYMGPLPAGTFLTSIKTDVPISATFATTLLPSVEAALVTARSQRPEVVAARARVAAANASIAYERSLAVRQTGATFGNKRVAGVNSIVAGFSLTIPLFNVNRSAVDRATAERLAAEHELAWVERLVETDLQAAHAAAMQLTAQLNELGQTFLARAASVHQLTLGAYQEGGATLLQVIDATRMLADARLTYSRTLFVQRESLFRLALASGAEPLAALDVLRAWSTTPAVVRAGDQP